MVEIVLGWLVCILFSTRLGSVRGRTGDGFAAGFLLGPVGVIYAGFMPYGTVKCDYCRMWCFKDADVCHNCGTSAESIDPLKM
ncbi:hypothetical protein OAE22_01000 [bacterium]|nr:hypothetical protein [bacterium]